MAHTKLGKVDRRRFIKTAGIATAFGAVRLECANALRRNVAIIADTGDSIASSALAQWAARELEQALRAQDVSVRLYGRVDQAGPGDLCILMGDSQAPSSKFFLRSVGAAIDAVPEALGLIPGKVSARQILLACGYDARGLAYALLDLADRVQNSTDPLAALDIRKPVIERPANSIRSLARLFVSDVEDKPWFYDREMWPRYLTMLAAQRFNRFNLSFGIGYDFLTNVKDAYFLFAYPFLVAVPGYNVRAVGLPEAERERNLATLQFIGAEAVARGLQFQLGLWMHGYEWIRSPKPNYSIEGLSRENHGPYSRDALLALLQACPSISGITFRIHGESGVPEGNYDLWKTIFDGVARCGRKVEIDMHAKGMDQNMIEVALATGMPVNISPKYWAEHLGMAYHQAEIRELERPVPGTEGSGLMKLSAGSRSFMRYGYGDLLRGDRRYGVLHRIWPGTQRVLLWGDPLTAAGYGRAFRFCGSAGAELMEPLSFKGRRGSGIAGGRCGYAAESLKPRWDWEKYQYSLRVWGRLLYNPESDPDVWRRFLRKKFGAAASAAGEALANASRILPIVTTAHGASAANNMYWVEMYTNQSIVDPRRGSVYGDSPTPKVFGNVSPFDPRLFSRINDWKEELLKGDSSGKYSPIEVAQWIEDYAEAAGTYLTRAEASIADKNLPDWMRLAVDVTIQVGLGRFYGAKLRSAVLYGIYERTGDRLALEEAVKKYRMARNAWASLAEHARGIYQADITYGEQPYLRGHWLDRLPAIDEDIADMAKRLEQAKGNESRDARIETASAEALGRPKRIAAVCRHTPAAQFHPGQPLTIELGIESPKTASVRVYYRHVNQVERFVSVAMAQNGGRCQATIPAAYTDSLYPIQYYFELRTPSGEACLYPGFAKDLDNQPYFVIRRAGDNHP